MLFSHKQDKRVLLFRIAVLVVIIGVAAAVAAVRFKDKQEGPDPRVALAQCLTANGTKMYGAYWCPHCQSQKKAFGREAFDEVAYVECAIPGSNAQTPACKEAGITGYPTWVFANGDRASGEQPFSSLASKSGCTYDDGASIAPSADEAPTNPF